MADWPSRAQCDDVPPARPRLAMAVLPAPWVRSGESRFSSLLRPRFISHRDHPKTPPVGPTHTQADGHYERTPRPSGAFLRASRTGCTDLVVLAAYTCTGNTTRPKRSDQTSSQQTHA